MDPDATYKRMTDAYRDRDWQGVIDSAEDLREWTERGGYTPEGHDARSITRLCLALTHDAVNRSRIEGGTPPCP